MKCHASSSKNVIWMSVDMECLKLDKFVLLGCVYMPPDNYYVLLMGDMNARLAHKPDFVTLDDAMINQLNDDRNFQDIMQTEDTMSLLGLPEKRASCDDKSNNSGNKLLELCKINMLYLFNGRVG